MDDRTVEYECCGSTRPAINAHRLTESDGRKDSRVTLSRASDADNERLGRVSATGGADMLRRGRVGGIERIQSVAANQLRHQLAQHDIALEEVEPHGDAVEQKDRPALARRPGQKP